MKYALLLLPCAMLVTLCAYSQRIPLVDSQEAIKKAAVLQDSGKYDLAIKELLSVPARDTNYVASLAVLAVVYRYNKQYDEAIAAADRVLKTRSAFASSMISAKAAAYDGKKEYDKAMDVLQAGLKEFPFDIQIRFLIATTYHNTHRYPEAVKAYYDVLEIYPYSAVTHLNLGRLAVWVGNKTHAMLSMGMYLSLKENDNAELRYVEGLAGNGIEDEGEGALAKPLPNAFERLDQILQSKIAMDKKFKTEVDIDAATVKQFEMLFQQLNTASTDVDDPWLKFYGPIYATIRDQKMITPFINHILTSSPIESVKKWNAKNDKTRQQFFKLLREQLLRDRHKIKIPASLGLSATSVAQYGDDNRVYAIGPLVNGQQQDNWIYFYSKGQRSAEGKYNNGKKVGLWKYYHEDGTRNTFEDEDTGKITGFYPDNTKSVEYIQKDSKVEGEIVFYYPCGSVSEKRTHKDGKRWGKGQLFYQNGTVKSDFEYADGKLTNAWIDYDVYGKVKSKVPYKDGLVEGAKESYWPDGKIKEREMYVADEATGLSEGFYENGKPQYKGMNSKNLSKGEWLYYDRLGNLSERRWYNDEGKQDKETVYYSEGKMSARYSYAKGMIVKGEYFNPSGKEIWSGGSADGNFDAKHFYETGELLREGKYKAGRRDGKWTQYNRDGTMSAIYHYADGEVHGEQTDFYKNGKKKIVSTYVNGVRDGYVQEFYYNGQVSREGWLVDGEQQQQWVDYFEDGSISNDYFYLNNHAVDSAYIYSVEGDVVSRNFYKDDKLVAENNFDPTQRTFFCDEKSNGEQKLKFPNGNQQVNYSIKCGQLDGTLERFYPDGKTYYKYAYVNGQLSGQYNAFEEDGTPRAIGAYYNGNRTGMWHYWNEAGKPDQVVKYVGGLVDSTLVNYYEHGAVYNTAPYIGDERNGVVQYLAPNGQPVVEKKYRDDDIIAYRMTGKNGQFGDWMPVSQKMSIVAYYTGGQKAYEEEYVGGIVSGMKRIYFPDGKPCKEYNYVDGEEDGAFADYYPNGKVCIKGQNRFGERDGVMEVFLENGMPLKTITYRLGRKSGPTTLFTKGVKSKEVVYHNGLPMK